MTNDFPIHSAVKTLQPLCFSGVKFNFSPLTITMSLNKNLSFIFNFLKNL